MAGNDVTTLDATLVSTEDSTILDIQPTTVVGVADSNAPTNVVESGGPAVDVTKQEYAIVGDTLYATYSAESTPPWLTEIVDSVVSAGLANGLSSLSTASAQISQALTELEVAKNTYTETINIAATVDGIVSSRLETLNASLDNATSDIVRLDASKASRDEAAAIVAEKIATELDNGSISAAIDTVAATKVTPEEAAAIAEEKLSTSLNSGSIKSQVDSINSSFATLTSSFAATQQTVDAKFTDLYSKAGGSAYAEERLYAEVGLDPNGQPNNTGLLQAVDTLQRQNDGVIMTTTGNYAVVTYSLDGNGDPDPATYELVTNVDPYQNWLPTEGIGAPTHTPEQYSLYTDITTPASPVYYMYTATGWNVITEQEFLDNEDYVRVLHVGDTFLRYDTDPVTGIDTYHGAYRFVKTEVDTVGPPYSTDSFGYTWVEVTDSAAATALAKANDAYDLADGKRRTFVATPTAPYDIGDLWLVDTNDTGIIGTTPVGSTRAVQAGDILRAVSADSGVYNAADWVYASNYTNDQYAIDLQNGVNQINLSNHVNDLGWQTASEVSTTASSTLNTWVTDTYDVDQLAVQTSLDGKIESYFTTNGIAPYDAATATADKDGDLWYDSGTKLLKRLVYSQLAWVTVEDQAAIDAATAASTAQSTADGKIVTFLQGTVPTSAAVGDIWIDTSNNNKHYRAASQGATTVGVGAWEAVTDDSSLDNFITVTYAADLLATQNQIDGKSVSYFQDTQPYDPATGADYQNGDVWYNTTNSELRVYNFSTLSWDLITDPYIQGAYDDAATAQATADGKIQNFTSEPTTPYYVGDTWMQGATGDIYVCNTEALTGPFNAAHWEIASKYTDNTLVQSVIDGNESINLSTATIDGNKLLTTYVTDEIDQKINIYSGTTAPVDGQPVGAAENDLYVWFTTATSAGNTVYDVTKTYKYSTTGTWVETTTGTSDISALADITDGKRTIFSNLATSVPTGAVENDIWIPSSSSADGTYLQGGVYQYSAGGTWDSVTKTPVTLLTESFENGIDKWTTTANDALTVDNTEAYTYTQSGLFTSTETAPNSTGTTQGSYVEINNAVLTAGNYVLVELWAKQPTTNAAAEFAVAYSTNSVGNSGWQYFTPTTTWQKFSFTYLVSADNANADYLGVWADTSGSGLGVLIDDITVSVLLSDGVKEFVKNTYIPTVATLESQADGIRETYYVTGTPGSYAIAALEITGGVDIAGVQAAVEATYTTPVEHSGDILYFADVEQGYHFNGRAEVWIQLTDVNVLNALNRAATAQETADGKTTTYFAWEGTAQPSDPKYLYWLDTNGVNPVLKTGAGFTTTITPNEGDDLKTAFTGTAGLDHKFYVYTAGNWAEMTGGGLVANSGWAVEYDAYLKNGSGELFGAGSSVDAYTTTKTDGTVEAAFAYNTTTKTIGGQYHTAGFGLKALSGTGTDIDPYVSKFWINANEFEVTDGTTGYTPFSISGGNVQFDGKVSFSNVTGSKNPSNNLLKNSAPRLNDETNGWTATNGNSGLTAVLQGGTSTWAPVNGASTRVYADLPVADPLLDGLYFNLTSDAVPVLENQRYEAFTHYNAHRCEMKIRIIFRDVAGAFLQSDVSNMYPTLATPDAALNDWGYAYVQGIAPAGAATAEVQIRVFLTATSTNPNVFVTHTYLGKAIEGLAAADWSEGTSSGVSTYDLSSAGTTVIDGGRITTGTISADRLDLSGVLAVGSAAGDINSGSTLIDGGKITANSLTLANMSERVGAATYSIDVTETNFDYRLTNSGTWRGWQGSDAGVVADLFGGSEIEGDTVLVNRYNEPGDTLLSTTQWVYTNGSWLYDVALKVSGDAIIDGTIAANKMQIGGSNWITDSVPTSAANYKVQWYTGTGGGVIGKQEGGTWSPASTGHSVYGVVPGAVSAGTRYQFSPLNTFPIVGGKTYQFSVGLSAHRCIGQAVMVFRDANGTYLTEPTSFGTTSAESSAVQDWTRESIIAKAPNNATTVTVIAQMYVASDTTDPHLFTSKWYFSEAVEGQTVPNGYNAAGTIIDGNSIVTGTIAADKITTNTLTADKIVSADVVEVNSGEVFKPVTSGTTTATTFVFNFNSHHTSMAIQTKHDPDINGSWGTAPNTLHRILIQQHTAVDGGGTASVLYDSGSAIVFYGYSTYKTYIWDHSFYGISGAASISVTLEYTTTSNIIDNVLQSFKAICMR